MDYTIWERPMARWTGTLPCVGLERLDCEDGMRAAVAAGSWTAVAAVLAMWVLSGCQGSRPASIAVIPRTSGTMLWEPENRGAQAAAAELGERIYWNASTREDDIDGQIALVDRVTAGRFKGLVLAPDHWLALMTPVRRALASGLPIVIVGSPLPIPASKNLSYVLNDEGEGARLAVERVAALVHGEGEVALIGIDPDIIGITERARDFERLLAAEYPNIHIVARRMGSFNFAQEQEGVAEVLRGNPGLNVIVALTFTSTRGAVLTVQGGPWSHTVRVIGFDPESLPFDDASLDSLIVEDTRSMGERAVRLIHARLAGKPMPARVEFEPLLVTRENVDRPEIQDMMNSRWRPGDSSLKRSPLP